MALDLKALEDLPADDAFWQEVQSDIALAMLRLNGRAHALGIEAAASVGVNVDFDAVHQEALQATRRATFEQVRKITDTTREGLREAMISWQETGAGVPGQAPRGLPTLIEALRRNPKLLDEDLRPLFDRARAERIAATEVTRNFAEGNETATATDPTIGGYQWQTVHDELVCEICRPRDKNIYPKGTTMRPPAHVRCRCGWIPVSWRYIRRNTASWQGDPGAIPGREAWEEEEAPAGPRTANELRAEVARIFNEGTGETVEGAVTQFVTRNLSTAAQEIKEHGMATPERMFSLEWDGATFRCGPNLLPLTDTLQRLVTEKALPRELRRHTKEVIFSTQRNSADDYWSRVYKTPAFESLATGGDGNVVVYNGRSIGRPSLAHEMAHNWQRARYGASPLYYEDESGPMPRTLESDYGKAWASGEPPPSDYAKNSPTEDFAESVAGYFAWMTDFKRRFPRRAAVIQRLLKEPGYHG